jgi:antitoxin (DNA-binding transcriptional repressor) of toxin-antitoxin stability system
MGAGCLAKLAKIEKRDMRTVTIHVAKTQLSRLIEAALAGEEVVIAKGDKPMVRLVAIPQGQFKLGVLKPGALGDGPDFLAPIDDDELAAWEGGR